MSLEILRRRLHQAKHRCAHPHGRNAAYAGIAFEFESPAIGARQLFDELGPCPPGMTLDRIDPRVPYAVDNIRYASPLLQTLNRRCIRDGWRSFYGNV